MSGICASSRSPKEACTQVALNSSTLRCSGVGLCRQGRAARGVRVTGERAAVSQPARRQAAGEASTAIMLTRTCCRACSHRRRAPMRSPPSYLALPLDSSCSACTRLRVWCGEVWVTTQAGGSPSGACGVGDAAWCWLCTCLQLHAGSRCCLMRTSTDARQGVSCRRRAAGGRAAAGGAGEGGGRQVPPGQPRNATRARCTL